MPDGMLSSDCADCVIKNYTIECSMLREKKCYEKKYKLYHLSTYVKRGEMS